MKQQTAKTITEREKEKKLAVMHQPALPSKLITSFGGLRSEKLLSKKLSRNDLGIKKKSNIDDSDCDGCSSKIPKIDEVPSEPSIQKNSSLLCDYSSTDSES